jgi:predicted GNAT family N-acyltransferase
MNIKFSRFPGTDNLFHIALNIRREVFVEEQQIDSTLEFDGLDIKCIHYLGYVEDIPVATARIRTTNDGLKLERFAVLINYRNKGIGKLLLEKIIKDELTKPKKIYLNSQITALRFYKNNGFKVVGQKFYEAGIEHYKMLYTG